MAAPAWQTADLDEEWVESSPSPPALVSPLPAIPPPNPSVASINAKRGSLRALGHPPRALPPPRVSSSPTTGSPRIISGHGAGRVLSEKRENVENGAREDKAYGGQGGLLSPPGSGDEQAGTFLVKDGVDDDRGRFLASKGRDMFGPTALEKMFRPPSPKPPSAPAPSTSPTHPPPSSTHPTASPTHPPPSSPTPPPDQLAHARRASHPYAPANPSRLSKSVTPSTASASSSFSATLPHDVDPASEPGDTSLIVATAEASDESDVSDRPARSLQSGEVETDLSPLGSNPDYPFTFTAPRPAPSPLDARPVAFDAADTTHSTVHHASPPKGLRLFRGTYDTYTREHLSALVDSIAVDPSPSPGDGPEWSPERGPHDEASSAEASSDSRSSKRMRMSPVSPARRLAGVRDWAREGREMMERLRQESTTSAVSTTSTGDSGAASDEASVDYAARSPTQSDQSPITTVSRGFPPVRDWAKEGREMMERMRLQADSTTSASPGSTGDDYASGSPSASGPASSSGSPPASHPPPADRPTHRSYPSTTSSTYLRRAEELMAQIQARGGPGERSPSTSSGSDAERHGGARSSPRRLLRRLSASEEIRRARDASSGDESDGETTPPLEAPQPAEVTRANLDNLNRFVSATTAATSTTTSTSYVKHQGARAPSAMRVIKPDDVAGIVGDRVGKMRYDHELMRWVKVREPLSRVDEMRETSGSGGTGGPRSGSGESDVFAGMNSWGRESRLEGSEQTDETEGSEETEGSSSEEGVIRHADTTRIVAADASLTTDSDDPDREGSEAHSPSSPSSPSARAPPRPAPHHASSAPAVMTPTPNPNASLPRPIRSALRTANPGATPGVKKQTQWHESVTPAPGSSRRSVSFSDGKKHGKIRELHPDETIETVSEAEGVAERLGERDPDNRFFRGMPDRSWMPSARTKRIEGMLGGMQALSMDEGTPSKPRSVRAESLVSSPLSEGAEGDADADRTIMPGTALLETAQLETAPRRAPRADPNATFLTECSFGVAQDKLVQAITDVYGSEPYWEHPRSLDLRGKNVESAARLEEFLPNVEQVVLNDNKLSYLSGIPATATTLHVARNRLSSLSSVDHLHNLRFLDISENQLDSVAQLACLVHLQELKLDGNAIADLYGILGLRQLTKLSAKRNRIVRVDVERSEWQRLQTLNLADNRVTKISGLARLTCLRELTLDGNRLERFDADRPLALRSLRISGNHLSTLDLSCCPKLRTLYADRNALSGLRVPGAARIEVLSLRNQRATGLELSRGELAHVKRLYLSGNPLPPDFLPAEPLASLTYLEIAACSLTSWPSELRRRLPNLEILNANYNYFHNLDGLAQMKSLRKISVVGARLGGEGAKGVMRGMKGLDRVEEVDLRMNPSTLGFYLPLMLPPAAPAPPRDPPLHVAQNPLPSVTLATIRPPDCGQAARPDGHSLDAADWAKLDGQFRKALPDEWYSKRLAYRGFLMGCLPRLRVLDGVVVEEGERRKAEMLLRAAEAR